MNSICRAKCTLPNFFCSLDNMWNKTQPSCKCGYILSCYIRSHGAVSGLFYSSTKVSPGYQIRYHLSHREPGNECMQLVE